jgi:hypothetical protein
MQGHNALTQLVSLFFCAMHSGHYIPPGA